MQHFFVTPDQVSKDIITITGSDVNHMKNVLRMKVGEQLFVNDGHNKKYLGRLREYAAGYVLVEILEEEVSKEELPSKIYLFQGIPKSDKMEWIIQKAVELGVSEVIPVLTKRSVVKLDEKKAAKKVERWREIAKSAAKQSGRGMLPSIREVTGYKQALAMAEALDVILIPYELAENMEVTRSVISDIEPGHSIGVFIGPEGGFEKTELEEALKIGAKEITLGRRILRTETAGLTVLSILMYHLEK